MTNHETSSIDEYPIPSAIAEQMAALGLTEPPATLGEWVDATTQLLRDRGVDVGVEAMYTVDRDRHEAKIGDDVQCFHCVLDTLLLPFVQDDSEVVEIRSRSPVSGDIIEMHVSRDGIDHTPEAAVMSFGVAADIEEPAYDAINPDLAYERFCPYVNAFTSKAEYEQWAQETPEAVTVGLPMDDAYALARNLGERSLYG